MPVFATADEAYARVGGILREAAVHPTVGPRLAAMSMVLQVNLTDPDAAITLRLFDPIEVEDRSEAPDADLTITMSADIADRFWRGEYNLAVGLARQRIQVEGPVEALLAIVPLTRPLYPTYRKLSAPPPLGRAGDA